MIESLPYPLSLHLLAGCITATLCLAATDSTFADPAGASPWVKENYSRVRLVSGTVSNAGNNEVVAGVQIRLDPGWKTYWRSPGDSGVPPSFDWSGWKNLKEACHFHNGTSGRSGPTCLSTRLYSKVQPLKRKQTTELQTALVSCIQ